MTYEVAMVLSTALTQYIENSSDMEPSEQPADLALAQKILDEVDAVLVGDTGK
jgi:hypothetical protein